MSHRSMGYCVNPLLRYPYRISRKHEGRNRDSHATVSELRSRQKSQEENLYYTANPSEEVHSRTYWGSLLLRLDAARTHRTVLERVPYSAYSAYLPARNYHCTSTTALSEPNFPPYHPSIIPLHQSHYSDLPKRTSPPSDIPCPHKSQQSASQPAHQASNRQTLLHPPTHPQPINHNPI